MPATPGRNPTPGRRSAPSPGRGGPARLFVAVALLLSACAAPKAKTTFLRSVDLVEMTDHMAQSFANAPAVKERTARSPRWVVSMDKVVNHTSQIIPENEKWLYVGRLRGMLTQTRLSDSKNIAWIVPPERWPAIAQELGLIGEPPELRIPPTHLLSAEFSSLTSTGPDGRSDAYLCAFQIVDLASGALIWEDAWEAKRAISGKLLD